ncbi:unnamed protein product [Pseudo-nitzschia multistriata]|uniref:Nuclear pore localisation protein NPL4 C-terminal domain-containing protein n=1 Tax=Pseudo-nitzschia multistriata TaxID=183589 RepID=A0A448Z1G2_9STRA|nr:unnamed protein product [Pseudo-nitzschia multistriata]
MLLRVRLADGSMERVQVEEGKEDTLTLEDVLKPFGVSDDASITIGTSKETAIRDSFLANLGVRNGSMITVMAPKEKESGNGTTKPTSRFASRKASASKVGGWNPYPDLAKDYDSVVIEAQKRRASRQSMSYDAISKLQSSLHVVDPQKEGPLLRVYMCRVSAERFYSNGVVTASKSKKKQQGPTYNCRAGLLLGTIQKERVDQRPKKARTSLSSQTADSEYCKVAKIQAIWEPPGQKPSSDKLYDAKLAASLLDSSKKRMKTIANHLGLVPVGWIFSYQDDRLKEENSFSTEGPQALFGLDVTIGAKLKIQNMEDRRAIKEDDVDLQGDRFVTLAMDATSGATEAFQLSDVCVQMVHEDMFQKLTETDGTSEITNPPIVPVRHAVLVDGRETKLLDSVLCLVNTALLSHVGSYSGHVTGSSVSVKKINGSLTNKTKKLLLKALESSDANDFLQEICDFNILMALDQLLSQSQVKSSNNDDHEADMEILCGLVRKWARGQKKGTAIDPKFKRKLQTYLST